MLAGGAWDHGAPRGRAPGRPGGSTGGGWRSSPPPPTRSIPPRTWNCLSRACLPASARRGPPPRSPPPAPVPRGGVPPASCPWGSTPTGRGGNSPRPPVWASWPPWRVAPTTPAPGCRTGVHGSRRGCVTTVPTMPPPRPNAPGCSLPCP